MTGSVQSVQYGEVVVKRHSELIFVSGASDVAIILLRHLEDLELVSFATLKLKIQQ